MQVQRFVNELQRISLLWDELWLGTLQQYSGDITKRIKRMEDEVARLNRNPTLSAEEKKLLVLDKYNIVFKPLLYVFEKVWVQTLNEHLNVRHYSRIYTHTQGENELHLFNISIIFGNVKCNNRLLF